MMLTATRTKPSNLVTLVKFFGKKDGQSSIDLASEIRELSDTDQADLAEGIRNQTLTY